MMSHRLALPYAYLVLCGLVLAILLVRVLACSRRNRRERDKRTVALVGALGLVHLTLGIVTLLIIQEVGFVVVVLILSGLWILYLAVSKWLSMRGEDYFEKLCRNDPDFCGRCGYNLAGNISGVCPECGWKLPERKNE
jgi:heme A synthase